MFTTQPVVYVNAGLKSEFISGLGSRLRLFNAIIRINSHFSFTDFLEVGLKFAPRLDGNQKPASLCAVY